MKGTKVQKPWCGRIIPKKTTKQTSIQGYNKEKARNIQYVQYVGQYIK